MAGARDNSAVKRPRTITSPENARVKRAARLREQRERRRTGRFLAEGARAIGRAASVGLVPESLFFCPEILGVVETGEGLEAVLPSGIGDDAALFAVSRAVIRKLAYRNEPEGLVGVLPTPAPRRDPPAGTLFLVAVGLEKPGNVGALARTADAAGADGLVIADAVVDPYHPNAIRASAGAVFALPLWMAPGERVRGALAERGVAVAAASPDAAEAHTETDLCRPVAIAVGPEDRGLEPAWREAGAGIAIPMAGRVADSLNVAASAAVLLFEARRQRGAGVGPSASRSP